MKYKRKGTDKIFDAFRWLAEDENEAKYFLRNSVGFTDNGNLEVYVGEVVKTATKDQWILQETHVICFADTEEEAIKLGLPKDAPKFDPIFLSDKELKDQYELHMPHLNDMRNFSRVSATDMGHGKVCLNRESFWLGECHKGDNNRWTAEVNNCTMCNSLMLGDKVTFTLVD